VLFTSIFLIVQSSITMSVYGKNNIKTDGGYYTSIAMLIISILALILSGLGLRSGKSAGSIGILFIALLLIVQSAITIYTYNKNNITKESKYYFSVSSLVLAIVSFILCGLVMKRGGGGAPGVVAAAVYGKGDLLPIVDPVKIAASGTPQNVENLFAAIQKTGAAVKAKVDVELAQKQKALQALLETVQSRVQSTTEATAALASAKTA